MAAGLSMTVAAFPLSNVLTEAGTPPPPAPDLSFIGVWLAVGLAIFLAATALSFVITGMVGARFRSKRYG
jgi:hypothetical protein